MKKTLAVVLALAMVLVMSVSVFAAEKPADAADTAAWTAYYTEVLADAETDPVAFATEVVADVTAGVVTVDVAVKALEEASIAVGTDAVYNAVLGMLPPSLPDILPEDETTGALGWLESIFDSIFNMIGDIVASLFGNDTADYCFKTTTTTTTTTTELVEDVPEMGDNSLIAVGAVALVAGAALVLTRKRDAE